MSDRNPSGLPASFTDRAYLDGYEAGFAKGFAKAQHEIDRLCEALASIRQWAEAYPLDIFPEPDLKRAHEVLTAHGMTIDSISASASRHVLKGIIEIIDAGLTKEAGQ